MEQDFLSNNTDKNLQPPGILREKKGTCPYFSSNYRHFSLSPVGENVFPSGLLTGQLCGKGTC